jgi:hypothetical protein
MADQVFLTTAADADALAEAGIAEAAPAAACDAAEGASCGRLIVSRTEKSNRRF